MCGIAGIAGGPDREPAVRRMMVELARRGPDADGLKHWSHATLGHRRLSIFDLSPAGRQPMLSTDGSIGVVFNGAIYNFRELRRDLERRGRRFCTETDTEVLIEGYQVWGIDVLVSKLRGMFAFALWDDGQRTMFLVRDRLGVKPLVYSIRGSEIAFASTVRALVAGIGGEIDPQAVAEYLEFGFVTDDRTIYREMKKLPAASILEWHEGGARQREYWHPSIAQAHGSNFEEAVAESERRLLEAVEMRLQADVPIGALLSGGIDSSLVCWAITRLRAKVRAFTIGTPGDDEHDETADARRTAIELGIDHDVIDVSPEDAPSVDDLVAAYGEPFACPSALGMVRVSRAVKSSATVLLTGDGGDDCFLGYPEHRRFFIAERVARRIPKSIARCWTSASGDLPVYGPFERARRFLAYSTGGLGAVALCHDGLPYYRRNALLGERLRGVEITQRAIPLSHNSATRLLSDFQDYHRRTFFVGEFMTKVDGGTMYYGLEARSPFLDYELWNYAQSLPYALRLKGGLKGVLRELARRRIGERVASGRKRGFRIPVQRWLATRWRQRFEELLHGAELEAGGWITVPAVLKQLSIAGERGVAPIQLWYLYVLENWLRRQRATEMRAHPAFGSSR